MPITERNGLKKIPSMSLHCADPKNNAVVVITCEDGVGRNFIISIKDCSGENDRNFHDHSIRKSRSEIEKLVSEGNGVVHIKTKTLQGEIKTKALKSYLSDFPKATK